MAPLLMQKEKMKVAIKKVPWGISGRAVSMNRSEGVTKMIFDPDTHRILGVAICGPHAGEMISEGVLAVDMGLKASDLAEVIHPHPTLSETIGEVAHLMAAVDLTGK